MLNLWIKRFVLDGGLVGQQVWTLIFVLHVIAVVLNLRDFAVMAQTIGVGFRNAEFEEISKPDIPESVLPTIQRWMNRCFLRILKVLINSWSHYFRLFCKKRIRRFKGNWNFARTITEWKYYFFKAKFIWRNLSFI